MTTPVSAWTTWSKPSLGTSLTTDAPTGPVVYIRTWEIPRGLLRRILLAVAIEDVTASGEDVDAENDVLDLNTGAVISTLPSAWAWADNALPGAAAIDLGETFNDSSEIVYARYVGQTRDNPCRRQFDDENRPYGHLKRFLELLECGSNEDQQVVTRLHYFTVPNGE